MNKSEAERILAWIGYNYALSDVEEACAVLDHPELTEEDSANYHKWADPYPSRCYCAGIAYTDQGAALCLSSVRQCEKDPPKDLWHPLPGRKRDQDQCGEPYIKKK